MISTGVGSPGLTPVGAVVRDLLPRNLIRTLKRPFERSVEAGPEPTTPASTTPVTIDDLRRIAPEECARVEAEYQVVRRDFIDQG